MKEEIEQQMEDVLLGFPVKVEVGRRFFYIHPKTLGKTLLLNRMRKQLDIKEDNVKADALAEALRVVKENRENAILMVAYLLAKSKEEMYVHELITDATDFLEQNLTEAELATLLCIALRDDDVKDIEKYFNLDKDLELRQKVAKLKKSDNVLTFGGHTIWGGLIGPAIERWGLTFDEVVWKLSYANLTMLLHDALDTAYLTDEERKKGHICGDNTVIDADDPKNWARIRAMKWD